MHKGEHPLFKSALNAGIGGSFTLIVMVADAFPQPLVAVTVYVVVIVGVTETNGPVIGPGTQANGLVVLVAEAIRLTEVPLHMVVCVALTLIVGGNATKTVTVEVDLQPNALKRVTVYVVVTAGDTVMLAFVLAFDHK